MGGFNICGRRSGQRFVDSVRPVSIEERDCPKSTYTCNPKASPDNKICRSNGADCPINFLDFSSSKDNQTTDY